MKFAERLKAASERPGTRIEWSPTALGRALDVSKQTAARWMGKGQPSADTVFMVADKLKVDPRWLATGEGEMVAKPSSQDGELEAHEIDLVTHYRRAEPRWRLALQLLAAVATDDQIEAATDVNMVMARIFGKKPRELRPIGDAKMREILKRSPQGWPPREAKAKEGK